MELLVETSCILFFMTKKQKIYWNGPRKHTGALMQIFLLLKFCEPPIPLFLNSDDFNCGFQSQSRQRIQPNKMDTQVRDLTRD